MTLHIIYDHRCPKCGARYIPYDQDIPCPNCGIVEDERFDYIPKAVESMLFNLEKYGSYVPPSWVVESLGDHILDILFEIFDQFRRKKKQKDFATFVGKFLSKMKWKDQEEDQRYLEKHVHEIAIRIHKDFQKSVKERLEIADKLIKSAHIFAVGTYIPMLDKFPELESVAKSNLLEIWDYLITIACVGTAFMKIADSFPELKEVWGVTHAIRDKLKEWKSDSYNAMIDFLRHVDKLVDSGVEIPDAIGSWIWANLEKRDQSNKRLKELASSPKLVKVVGMSVLVPFRNWWEQK